MSALTFNEYTRGFEHIRNSYNRDNVEFWNTLKSWLPNLVHVDIYGGEPFLMPALFDWLEYGIIAGDCKNITINLHTNCSIDNLKYLEILSKYKKVGFRMSIDSADPLQLEYIRNNASFSVVSENIQKFKSFFQNHSNVELSITYTVTPLNVYYIDQDTDQLEKMFGLPVLHNLVTTPEYDIRHLPTEVKNYLTKKTKNSIVVEFLKQIIPGCDVEWPKFCKVTDKLDQLRNQDFKKVFPDWWKILEPYWIKL
jgi:sulfatase maturation enzyme AslB (radical SAM superfamily)